MHPVAGTGRAGGRRVRRRTARARPDPRGNTERVERVDAEPVTPEAGHGVHGLAGPRTGEWSEPVALERGRQRVAGLRGGLAERSGPAELDALGAEAVGNGDRGGGFRGSAATPLLRSLAHVRGPGLRGCLRNARTDERK